MRQYPVNRPDEAAMRRILDQNGPESVILRLAWQAGLAREEIAALTWDQVSFLDNRLELPDRTVPLEEELRSFLWQLAQGRGGLSPHVVLSSRSPAPLKPESISRLARQALDREGQTAVRLMDLRHDWILRRLETGDWPAVARISGVEVPALQARFAPLLPGRAKSAGGMEEGLDEFKLWKVLQSERATPAGLALWLTWQLGLQAREIAALTWDQVDLEAGSLRLADRRVPMTNAVRRLLEEAYARRQAGDPPQVLLTTRSRSPVDLPRLSRMTRAALIRGGMEQVQLRRLRKNEDRTTQDARLLDRVAEEGAVSRGDVMALLGVSKTAAHHRLRRLTEEKKLVRVGGKYYLPGTVTPPERHQAEVEAYIAREGFAYRQDVAALLRIQPKQCTLLLRRMVAAGRLVQTGQKYTLPPGRARRAE